MTSGTVVWKNEDGTEAFPWDAHEIYILACLAILDGNEAQKLTLPSMAHEEMIERGWVQLSGKNPDTGNDLVLVTRLGKRELRAWRGWWDMNPC